MKYFSVVLFFVLVGFSCFSFAAEISFDSDVVEMSFEHPADTKGIADLKKEVGAETYHCVSKMADALQALKQKDYKRVEQKLSGGACPILADYQSYYLAYSLAHLGQYAKALEQLAVPKDLKRKIDRDRFWLRMKVLAYLKKTTQIQAETQAFTKYLKQDSLYAVRTKYYLGLSYFIADDLQKAFSCFSQIIVDQAGTEYDQKVQSLLNKTGHDINELMDSSAWVQRARRLSDLSQATEALAILNSLYEKDPGTYLGELASGIFSSRDYAQAAQLYEKLLVGARSQDQRLTHLVRLSQAYARSDQLAEAIQINKTIIQEFPQAKEAADARYKVAYLEFDRGAYQKAIDAFQAFVTDKNKNRQRRAHEYRAWSFYLLKRYQEALDEWGVLEKKTTAQQTRKKITYWRARCLDQLKKEKEAKLLYRNLSQKAGLDYYALLAKQRIQKHALDNQTLFYTQRSLAWSEPLKKRHIFEGLNETDPLYRAILLAQLGLDLEAYAESQTSSRLSAATVSQLAQAGYYSRLSYPKAYDDYVLYYARTHRVEPALIWAIMHQESRFRPDVESKSLAQGLMQIMPETGRQLAAELGLNNYDASFLKQPALNICLGARYLANLQKEFSNNLILTIAAYNAGPEAVKNWKRQRGYLEWDEWIELIPYSETKDYVMKVLVNELVYR